MNFDDYQKEALKTDKNPALDEKGVMIPLLGLAGETGELLSEYKKYLRDAKSHRPFKERMTEELGDLLWYLSNCASKFEISLQDVARGNLMKCRSRWREQEERGLGLVFISDFDSQYPESERLPRRMTVTLEEIKDNGKIKLRTIVDGRQIGNELTDNSLVNDGYRYHDVFHFAYAAVLGWSPVVRGILKRKRRSDPQKDEVDDGGRAIAIEEGISAMMFSHASRHDFYTGIEALDYEMIRLIRAMASGLEVSRAREADWEKAVFLGFQVWRVIQSRGGGSFVVDLDKKSMEMVNVE